MLSTILNILILTLAAALTLVTLLPMSASQAWWIRIWDFPRLHIAGGFALLLPLAALTEWGWPLAALAVAGFVYQMRWIRPYTRLMRREVEFAPDAEDGVTLLALNVLMENTRHDLVLDLIRRIDPDVLLLMETDATWVEAMAPALEAYPTVLRQPQDNHYGMVFATRLKVDEARLIELTPDDTPSALARLVAPNGRPFDFVGLHPQPPAPDGADTDERDAQIIYAARFARRDDVPVMTMGDFNEAAWSRRSVEFKRVGSYIDPRIGRGLFASFHAKHPMIRCPIDQFFATSGVAVVSIALGPQIGSDHLPMIARVRIDPDLGSRLNTPPKPLDPEEVERLDGIMEAYRRKLEVPAGA